MADVDLAVIAVLQRRAVVTQGGETADLFKTTISKISKISLHGKSLHDRLKGYAFGKYASSWQLLSGLA